MRLKYISIKERSGQSLIEIMIALAVGAILVTGALFIIAPTVKTGGDTVRIQIASGLGKELLENSRVMAEGNWHSLGTLATTSENKYHLIASTSPFTATSGVESLQVGTSTYMRYFYLEDVKRNGSNQIDLTGTVLDPSVKRIVVVYGWSSTTVSSTAYLARTNNIVLVQTDWSAGGGQEGPMTSTGTNSKFATSTNIDFTSSSGAIILSGF